MKVKTLYPMLATLLLLVAGCFMYACTPDKEEVNISPKSLIQNTTTNCDCSQVDLFKVVNNSPITNGKVTVCNDSENLYITFATTDYGSKALVKTQVGLFQETPTTLNPSPKYLAYKDFLAPPTETVSTTTIAIGDLTGKIYIAALATLQASGPNWGQGTDPQLPIFGNQNSRYFEYTILDCTTPPPPTDACSFSQGFWFAKPNVSWPDNTQTNECSKGSVMIGNVPYCYDVARDIFRSSNKAGISDAKKAFLQAATIKLSISSGKSIVNADVLTAVATIDTYFDNKSITPSNINKTNIFPNNTDIRTAAATIDAYIKANHCGGI